MGTIDAEEVARFSRLAGEWWDPQGKFKPLHRINPLRLNYIENQAKAHFKQADITGLRLLDIGCGGGLISEPLAKAGAIVTGLDASQQNIEAAKAHARQSGLAIDYRCAAAEDLLATKEQFDVVLALEIVEHVSEPSLFIAATCGLLKPGGLIIYSTINRTMKSFALAILGAEYVLRWIPRGTHDLDVNYFVVGKKAS